MSPETYQHIEAIVMNISLVVLFGLMGMAVHDVLQKNKVPLVGRAVAYGVLGLGAFGFLAKGLIQVFYFSTGVS